MVTNCRIALLPLTSWNKLPQSLRVILAGEEGIHSTTVGSSALNFLGLGEISVRCGFQLEMDINYNWVELFKSRTCARRSLRIMFLIICPIKMDGNWSGGTTVHIEPTTEYRGYLFTSISNVFLIKLSLIDFWSDSLLEKRICHKYCPLVTLEMNSMKV